LESQQEKLKARETELNKEANNLRKELNTKSLEIKK